MRGIVKGVVQAAAFLAGHGVTHDEVADIDKVTQLADFWVEDGLLVEVLRFTIEDFETVESALQTQVGAHDADIATHNGLQLLAFLRDEHHFLVKDGALTVPVGHVVAELDVGQILHRTDTGAM